MKQKNRRGALYYIFGNLPSLFSNCKIAIFTYLHSICYDITLYVTSGKSLLQTHERKEVTKENNILVLLQNSFDLTEPLGGSLRIPLWHLEKDSLKVANVIARWYCELYKGKMLAAYNVFYFSLLLL